MNPKDIISYVKKHPSGKVKIAYADMDGILRGKYISTAKFLSGIEKGTSFSRNYYMQRGRNGSYGRATVSDIKIIEIPGNIPVNSVAALAQMKDLFLPFRCRSQHSAPAPRKSVMQEHIIRERR